MLERVKLINYGKHQSLEVRFQPGLNAIIGSNGSGKSTIMSAVCYALTAENLQAGSNDQQVTCGAKKGGVELDLSHQGIQYRITRSLAGMKNSLKVGAEEFTKAPEINQELMRRLSTNPSVLLNNVFARQGKIDAILDDTPTTRLKAFQEVFGLEQAEKAYRLLGVEMSGYCCTPGLEDQLSLAQGQQVRETQEVDRLTLEVQQVQDRIQTLEGPAVKVVQQATLARQHQLALEAASLAIQGAQGAREFCSGKFRAALQALLAFQQELAAADLDPSPQQVQKADQLVQELQQAWRQGIRYEEQGRQLRELDLRHQTMAQPPAQDLQHAQQEVQLATDQLSQATRALSGQLPDEGHPLQQFREDLKAAQEALRALPPVQTPQEVFTIRAEIVQLKDHLAKFQDGKCPTCKQDLQVGFSHQDIPARIQTLEAQVASTLKGLEDNHTTAKARLVAVRVAAETELATEQTRFVEFFTSHRVKLEARLQVVQVTLQDLQGQVREWQNVADQVARIRQDLGDQPTLVTEQAVQLAQQAAQSIRQALAEQVRLQDQEQHWSRELARAEEALKTLESTRARQSGEYPAPDPEILAGALRDLEELPGLRQQAQTRESLLGTSQAKLAHLTLETSRMADQVRRESRDAKWLRTCQAARDSLHVSQYPAAVMRSHAGAVNTRIAHYLGVLEVGFRFWLDPEQMEFMAEFQDGRKHAASRLSGAQRVQACVSLRLALSDLFASQLAFVALDEPSAFLDPQSIQSLQTLFLSLKQVASRQGRQIILITHEQSLMGCMDHVIQVG